MGRQRHADVAVQDNVVIWEVPKIDPKYHTFRVYVASGILNLDYISYVPALSTSTGNDQVVLDDQDPLGPGKLLTYTGVWNHVNGKEADLTNGYAFNKTYSDASSVGASYKFAFTGVLHVRTALLEFPGLNEVSLSLLGSSISVYGLLNFASGRLSATYSVDGGPPLARTHLNGSHTVNAGIWATNQRLYHEVLLPGDHVLTVRITEATDNQVWARFVRAR